jgi:AcrR family transcriptional regulator
MASTKKEPPDGSSRRGKPKGDKRERTRAALLEAARASIREKGHEKTTLEEVARRAGMTTGAIYGNFKNRDELFIALAEKYWAPVAPKVAPGATLAEAMRALAKATVQAVHDRAPAAVGRLTGMAYASELPMPPDVFVRVLHALIEGLVLQRILTPDLFPDEVFYEAFAALVRGKAGERGEGGPSVTV